MDRSAPRAVYVHIPFCAHRCGYCDFAVSTDTHLAPLYLDALAIELCGEPVDVETIFIGGGTPTLLDLDQLHQLFTLIHRRFTGETEISVESTPHELTTEKLTALKECGVTRVSLGVQSFNGITLASLDRQHDVRQIHDAVKAVQEAGLHYSLDLIFGAPGQTLSDWQVELRCASAIGPDHVSTYGLTFEKGTSFWKQRAKGELQDAGEDLELAMYEAAMDSLTAAGYEQYEISNFAKPGRRCRHNEYYWANRGYYGFGVGAARYLDGERCVNVRDTNLYIRRMLADGDATQNRERLPPRDRALETLAVQLRRGEGVQRRSFTEQTGFDLDDLAGRTIARMIAQELLTETATTVALTRRGKCLADAVIAELMTER